MTMRKLFAGAALTSIAGAILVGTVFAWRTSDYARGAALVGENGFEISYDPKCDGILDVPYLETEETPSAIPCHTLIGPNGSTTEVGRGAGKNTGDFKLMVVGGRVDIRRVHYADRECSTADFGGAVRLLSPGEVIPPGGEGGKFVAFVSVGAGAPASCQGELVYYKVTIEAENPPLPTTDAALVESIR